MPIVDVMSLQVTSVTPDETVQAAIGRMVDGEIGSVVVCEGSRLVGIFTERDVLRLAERGARFGEVQVGDVMTKAVATVSPDDDIVAAARLMAERKVRHLPVMEGENLLGIVGIRDVMGALAERLWSAHDPTARDTVHELLDRGRRRESS